MCCSLEKAHFHKTILYAAETTVDDNLVHVLGYQNQAENLSNGPNAMILPFPAAEFMGPENVIDTSHCKHVLKDIKQATFIQNFRRRSMTKGVDSLCTASASEVRIFNSGKFTVVMAKDARDIPGVLHLVPEDKRPKVNDDIFEAYAKWYKGWPVALCCFNGSVESEPMLWWYKPKKPGLLFAPALDSHNGKRPDLNADVMVDHTVAFGSYPGCVSNKVYYTDGEQFAGDSSNIAPEVKKYLPTHVIGKSFNDYFTNGDFWLPVKNIKDAAESVKEFSFDLRRSPPGKFPKTI
jgi:hypothetical protein